MSRGSRPVFTEAERIALAWSKMQKEKLEKNGGGHPWEENEAHPLLRAAGGHTHHRDRNRRNSFRSDRTERRKSRSRERKRRSRSRSGARNERSHRNKREEEKRSRKHKSRSRSISQKTECKSKSDENINFRFSDVYKEYSVHDVHANARSVYRSTSRSRSANNNRGNRHMKSRSRSRSRSRGRRRSASREHIFARNRSRSRSRSASPIENKKWTHEGFIRRAIANSPSPERVVPPDYEPPKERWVSRAGGVAIMKTD